jgi:hypothetical protein
MQKGSLIRSSRRQGPDVWEYRWRESCSGQTRKHRRIVIGTLNTLKDESAALKAISALRRDININDRRIRTKPLRLAELVEHYRQKELTTDNEWKTLSTRVVPEVLLPSEINRLVHSLRNREERGLLFSCLRARGFAGANCSG